MEGDRGLHIQARRQSGSNNMMIVERMHLSVVLMLILTMATNGLNNMSRSLHGYGNSNAVGAMPMRIKQTTTLLQVLCKRHGVPLELSCFTDAGSVATFHEALEVGIVTHDLLSHSLPICI